MTVITAYIDLFIRGEMSGANCPNAVYHTSKSIKILHCHWKRYWWNITV